jgi:hypothetical protein
MAGDARQLLAALSLACAHAQRLDVTHGPEPVDCGVCPNEYGEVVWQALTGRVVILRSTGRSNPRFAFEMALIANAVPPVSNKFAGIDHRPEAANVVTTRPVTSLAPYSCLQERLTGKLVDRAFHG